eukprot:4960917-Prymnesium_polylepis.1
MHATETHHDSASRSDDQGCVRRDRRGGLVVGATVGADVANRPALRESLRLQLVLEARERAGEAHRVAVALAAALPEGAAQQRKLDGTLLLRMHILHLQPLERRHALGKLLAQLGGLRGERERHDLLVLHLHQQLRAVAGRASRLLPAHA